MTEKNSMPEESFHESPHNGSKQSYLCGDAEDVAGLIKSARKRKRISQKDLAKLADMTAVQLCRIERGDCRPSRQTLRKLSGHIGVPYSELLIRAGYSSLKGDEALYKKDGSVLDADQIVETIYGIDSDFLEYFRNFEEIGTEENIQVMKMLLLGMRKEAEINSGFLEDGTSFCNYFQSSFLALKRFIVSSLSPITEFAKSM